MKYFLLLQAINAKFTTPDDARYLGMTNRKSKVKLKFKNLQRKIFELFIEMSQGLELFANFPISSRIRQFSVINGHPKISVMRPIPYQKGRVNQSLLGQFLNAKVHASMNTGVNTLCTTVKNESVSYIDHSQGLNF